MAESWQEESQNRPQPDFQAATAVKILDLHRTYGSGDAAVHALRGASLEIHSGEVVALTGPSGSGKTTLLNCLVGLDSADHGAISVFGASITDMTYEEAVDWRRNAVAIVFQSAGLVPHLTAWENVDMVLRMRQVQRADRAARIDEAFERLTIRDYADHRPTELSGGQQQRVALALALATRPPLLIADEPTGELDSETTAGVLHALRDAVRTHGTTMILATHDAEVEASADRALRMTNGMVVES